MVVGPGQGAGEGEGEGEGEGGGEIMEEAHRQSRVVLTLKGLGGTVMAMVRQHFVAFTADVLDLRSGRANFVLVA